MTSSFTTRIPFAGDRRARRHLERIGFHDGSHGKFGLLPFSGAGYGRRRSKDGEVDGYG
jgi:hypothetical protein